MPLSTDVTLPRYVAAEFPPFCVACAARDPDSHVTVSAPSDPDVIWLLQIFSKKVKVRAPACSSCAWKMHAGRWARSLLALAVIVAICWLAFPWLEDAPRFVQKLALAGLIFGGLIPYYGIMLFFPPPLDIEPDESNIEYKFRNNRYATLFHMLNEERVVKSEVDLGELDSTTDRDEPEHSYS